MVALSEKTTASAPLLSVSVATKMVSGDVSVGLSTATAGGIGS
jgi:hypothetical protein